MSDNAQETSIDDILLEVEERMEKSLESLKRDLATIRTSRASVSMVDHIQVEYYGAMTPLNQLATVSVPEARMIMISPFDKSSTQSIEKAILKSDLNITPQSDGQVIRIILPELTMDRRKELVKQVKARLEEARVSIRNVRRDGIDGVKKLSGKGHSEDEIKTAQDDIQKLTDKEVHNAETIATEKEESILTV